MKSVLIAGAGNFGCWWGASLCLDADISSITLYDPYVDNSGLALERARCLTSRDCSALFLYVDTLSLLAPRYDLVVVGSNSAQRYELYLSLQSILVASFWVLEKVLTSSLRELDSFLNMPHQSHLFVNHSRRMQPLWSSFKSTKSSNLPCLVKQRLGPWDLASNIFHFVDLISWLYSTSVDSVFISDSCWMQSEKRPPGYFDFIGSIEVCYFNGIVHSIDRDIEFKDNSFSFYRDLSLSSCDDVVELEGIVRLSNGKVIAEDFLQWSQLAHVFSKNLWRGNFMLPVFSDVYQNTRVVLESLQKDYFKKKGSTSYPFQIS